MEKLNNHRCYASRINSEGEHVCDICKTVLPTTSQQPWKVSEEGKKFIEADRVGKVFKDNEVSDN